MSIGTPSAAGLHRSAAFIVKEDFDVAIPGIIQPQVTRLLAEHTLCRALGHHLECITHSIGVPCAVEGSKHHGKRTIVDIADRHFSPLLPDLLERAGGLCLQGSQTCHNKQSIDKMSHHRIFSSGSCFSSPMNLPLYVKVLITE